MKKLAFAAASAIALAAAPAHAATVVGSAIEIDEPSTKATVDLWHFNLSADFAIDVGFANINFLPGDPNMSVVLYENDGAGVPTNALFSASTTGIGAVNIVANLLAGDYIIAVSMETLSVGEYGPVQIDPLVKNSNEGALSQYELFFPSGPQEDVFSYTCLVAGNLDGSSSVTKYDPGSNCRAAPAAVSEPGALGLVGLGTLAMGFAFRRRAL